MSKPIDVAVIGAGIGGLTAAIQLAARGLNVHVFERSDRAGGKAGTETFEGVEFDTGPSVLTLPHVFDEPFALAGLRREDEITLTQPSPGFRYHYQDGVTLDVHHHVEDTIQSVKQTLGSRAANELASYLEYARKIWQTAAPHFVYNAAPDVPQLLFGGTKAWGALLQIDPLRSLTTAIDRRVKSSHLRMLLRRYATYNGSDARRAPATLSCIAHVELSLGGYGVQGGMVELVRALERAARRAGAHFHFQTEVSAIAVSDGSVSRLELEDGSHWLPEQIVTNADATHLLTDLLPSSERRISEETPSMSAYTGVIRAARTPQSRPAHSVLFPLDYRSEFSDIFDREIVPKDPAIYLCALESAHRRRGWKNGEPVFAMINAPAIAQSSTAAEDPQGRLLRRLVSHSLIQPEDEFIWWRTPLDLAARFPGSRGSLYGAASNSATAAFRRPKNRVPHVRGLYLASGSAHPGGGVPLVALSGKQAAYAALEDRGIAA